ncbi:MAG: Gfo/Idh/MocA family oxidoreductase [Candidatus Poribacteria bacterium]
MLRIAVIGTGWAGCRQIEAVRELDSGVEVAALVDTDPEQLGARTSDYAVGASYHDYRDALYNANIDAVSICTPHASHGPIAVDAANAGKHVLVEKPMALDVAGATETIEAAEANDVRLYVAESATYTAESKFLRAAVRSGSRIGEVTGASLARGFRAPDFGYAGRREWLTRPKDGGTGTWMLHGIHNMAQLRYIFGEIETVYMREHAASSFRRGDIEATMTGLLTTRGGVNISVLQTTETRLADGLDGYSIYGDRGSIRASSAGCEFIPVDGPSQAIEYAPEALSEFAQEIQAFADYVTGAAVGPTTGYSERRTLAIVQAGYESAGAGAPVNLDERFGAI